MGRGKSPFFSECLFWSADCVDIPLLVMQKACKVLEVPQSCPVPRELGKAGAGGLGLSVLSMHSTWLANLNIVPGFHPARTEMHLNNIP